jgi:glycosidase
VLDYSDVARVPLAREAAGAQDIWRGSYRYTDIGIYGYYFVVDIAGKTYLYQNNADPIYWTRELGSNGTGIVSGVGDSARIRRYRQTVYRADYRVPAWASDIVYYYIFPERFRNGDKRNDPRPGVDKYHDTTVEFHQNWLDKPYLPHSGDGSDNVYGNDFFGGDLQGIIDKLDYIAALGANALYITPLFQAASNHKYDTADYKTIDPHFGTNADFVRLSRAAAKRGIRVIPDTSLNHSGSDSLYFDRYDHYPGVGAFKGGKIRPDSPYADWYLFDPQQTDPQQQYHGWIGAQDLPELNKASQSYRDYAFGANDAVMKLWLDRGAAGWRMDVAPWVPDEFWRAWRSAVKGHRADALTIAETQFDASKFFLGDEFDSTMNYIFRNAVQDYAAGKNAREAYRSIELMRENYPPQAFYALMNLLSTHDTERALYDFGYRDATQDSAETIALAKQRLRLAVFFQMIFPGAPAVFYGDEVGVTGAGDPFNRVTYPWPDLGGKPDNALLADYRKLIKLRKDHPVLRHGSIDAPAYIDDHVIVLIRRDGAQWAITATNNDREAHSVSIPLPAAAQSLKLQNVLTGASVGVAAGSIQLHVPALFGTVLVNQ